MKKTVTAAALLAALTFVTIQSASAHGGRYGNNNNYGYGCGNYNTESRAYTEKDQAAVEQFRADTSEIRREIVVKRSELHALMGQDNPNETKVAKLTGELYDLTAELDKKAETAGIDSRFAYGQGRGMMRGNGGGRGWHMMGW